MPYNCMWAWLQDAASSGIELLRALVHAPSDCSAAVGSAVQQKQRLPGNKQQPGELVKKAFELHERSMWLPAAAGSLMLLMREHMLYGRVDSTQQLLDILGQLLQEVLCHGCACSDSCRCTCYCLSTMSPVFSTLHMHKTQSFETVCDDMLADLAGCCTMLPLTLIMRLCPRAACRLRAAERARSCSRAVACGPPVHGSLWRCRAAASFNKTCDGCGR